MGSFRRLRPRWERWPGWWRQQQRVALARWGRGGRRTNYDAQKHLAWLSGSVKIGRGRQRRKWSVGVIWNAGSPFMPPQIVAQGAYSCVHQLNDGTMCLLPPVDPEKGWEGPLDIGFWMDRAEEWLRRYAAEGWGVEESVWPFFAAQMPGYRYRNILGALPLIGLPPAWRALSQGSGLVKVLLPRERVGMGAVSRWQVDGGPWETWDAAAAMVAEPRDEVLGTWTRLGGTVEELQQRLTTGQWPGVEPGGHFLQSWISAVESGSERIDLMSMPLDEEPGGRQQWTYTRRAAPARLPGGDPLLQFMAIAGLPKEAGVGLVFDDQVLDLRRLAGREREMHDTIAKTRFFLVGLGSLGSEVAHLLAQEGARLFTLMDGDFLLPGNEARHRADLADAGKPKVDAVADQILRIQPQADVGRHQGWLDVLAPGLGNDGQPEVVIGTTGEEATEHLLSDVCADLGLPCLHAWMEREGKVLRLVRCLPGRDPTLSEAAEHPDTPRIALARSEDDAPRACAENVLPGSAMNLHGGANFVVRAALRVAWGASGPDNHWLFSPEGVEGDDLPAELATPYGTLTKAIPLCRG